jgi:hypothetical protein
MPLACRLPAVAPGGQWPPVSSRRRMNYTLSVIRRLLVANDPVRHAHGQKAKSKELREGGSVGTST